MDVTSPFRMRDAIVGRPCVVDMLGRPRRSRLWLVLPCVAVLLTIALAGCGQDDAKPAARPQATVGSAPSPTQPAPALLSPDALPPLPGPALSMRSAKSFTAPQTSLEAYIAALASAQAGQRLKRLNELWIYAAHHDSPDAALQALQQAAADPDPVIAQQAKRALADLQRLRGGSQQAEGASVNVATEPPTQVADPLRDQALDAPSAGLRAEAIGSVALQRSADATEVLLAAASDPAPANRRKSIQALWISAKDQPQMAGRIQSTLTEALRDPDPAVATLAQQALDDLERVRERSLASPAPVVPAQPPLLPAPGQ